MATFKEITAKALYEVTGRPKKIADVGIELEIEGHNLPGTVPHWTVKSEGSLQEGLEYITKPIKIDAVETYVHNLNSYIKTVNGKIKPSYRCSTHIHLNCSTDTVANTLGTFVIFTMFEPIFLTLCGNQRNGNLFCMSSYDTGEVIQSFDNLCRNFNRASLDGFGFQRGKYSALNLDHLYDFGTLEARFFPLSLDGAQVREWASWLMNCKDMAVAAPDKTYREFWKNIRQNPEWHAWKLFGPKVGGLPYFNDLMELGTETAYELTRVLKTWYSTDGKTKSTRTKKKTVVDPIIIDNSEW